MDNSLPSYDVLVAGSYTIDMIFTGLPGMPVMGAEVYATGFDLIPGEAYNSAVAMHRLGLLVGWAGDFGNDDLSQLALLRLRQEGLDDSLFVHHPRPLRRISVAASMPADRGFITFYDPDPPVPAIANALLTASARLFYIPGLFAGADLQTALTLARAKGMRVAMDGNNGEGVALDHSGVQEAVQGLDLFLPNAREVRCLTGESDALEGLRQLGALCPLVVLKDGANGAYAIASSEVIHSPALPLTPLDTTGAGDCFNAGFIKAWLDGLPLETCLRWGNITGGLSTLAHGGTGRKITPEDVAHYLNA